MALLKIHCPECNAGLKSPTGFKVGQTVACPKCETYFVVEEPEEEEEEEEEAPRKKTPAKSKPVKKPVRAVVDDDDDEDEEEEEEEAPRKKKKKKKKRRDDDDEDEERSYKNSPLRFIILGILVIIMLVLGYMLYVKKQDEKNSAVAVPGQFDRA